MERKKLPIGITTFREIVRDGYYYVDKTRFAVEMARQGKYYFLSRPRRFGKSLFLDTLAELLAGNREFFVRLHAETHWDWSQTHPVIQLDFSEGRVHTRAELEQRTHEMFWANERRLGVSCPDGMSVPGRFSYLIEQLAERHGAPVVVLVDEYDKPILDNITDRAVAKEMRDGLQSLYSVLKRHDANLRFVFLTGVSKFSKVSIFSGLNNLEDLTLDARYADLCGYTNEDLDTVFAAELAGLDRNKIKHWYNGYSWLGQSVYNPFDVLLLFAKRSFRPYWFETGTPTFLIEWLRKRQYFAPRLEATVASIDLLSAFDAEAIEPEALLWQTGYLTIERECESAGMPEYLLTLPNHEVRVALTHALLRAYLPPIPTQPLPTAGQVYQRLAAGDLDGFHEQIKAVFASIPHDWYRNNPIARFEGYWASVFYLFLACTGVQLTPEDVTNYGRIDLAIAVPGRVYLFEFKVSRSGAEHGAALAQLRARRYAEKYNATGVPVHLVGVEFSPTERNLVTFEVETIS